MKILPNNQITIDLLGVYDDISTAYTLNTKDIIETWKEPVPPDDLFNPNEYLYFVLITLTHQLTNFLNSKTHKFVPAYYFIKNNKPSKNPHFQITEEDYTQIEKYGFNLGKTHRLMFILSNSYAFKPPLESDMLINPRTRVQG